MASSTNITVSGSPKEVVTKDEAESRARIAAFSELLFVVLPFIVIAITLGHKGELKTIFSLPEWSIVSAVIAGQSIVRLASAAMVKTVEVERESIVLVLSLILVCLLVPILVVLAIVLTADKISRPLEIAQGVFFIISTFVFWLTSWTEIWVRT